jgi:hypothetical protein
MKRITECIVILSNISSLKYINAYCTRRISNVLRIESCAIENACSVTQVELGTLLVLQPQSINAVLE